VFAVNAGQFNDQPWGLLVQQGIELQHAGTGPLAPAIVVGSDGRVRLVPPDSIPMSLTGAHLAFQSYPTLLDAGGVVPAALRFDGLGVDRAHRDARLALGLMRDGTILIAMTRFEGLGGVLENIPLGLTTPEMAAVMGALGAERAVLLDGGISSQMLIRAPGETLFWTGWRRVALGLIALPRQR
jgi:exopolysaccharide biosynthesis protein